LKITGAGNLEGGGLVFNPTGNRGRTRSRHPREGSLRLRWRRRFPHY